MSRLDLINNSMDKTYYTIYKITNKINSKIYIGLHKTKNLDDDYMGSGKYLKYSQNKHGLENFEKEILHVFDNPNDMYIKEAELVNKEFIAEENTYNLKIGGHGGWDYVNANSLAPKANYNTLNAESLERHHIGSSLGGVKSFIKKQGIHSESAKIKRKKF